MGSNVILGSFGVTGVKSSFSPKNANNSSMLYSMTTRLIHLHQLETFYLCNGVRCQPGVILGHRGQKVIFTENALTRPCYIA